MQTDGTKLDVFISHAYEDKETFVRPLAVALRQLGVNVWYDEFSLRPGDSLSRSIDKGIAGSRYGLVVVSRHFIAKPWPEYELRGLVAREIGEDRVIIPIWYGVTRQQVLDFSPSLADKIALMADEGAQEIAIKALREVRPDIYAEHPRNFLEKLASGQALHELQGQIEQTQEELEGVRQELGQYRCPHCDAELVVRTEVDVTPNDSDLFEAFACGHERGGGSLDRPCPKDPHFPKFEDYVLKFQYTEKESRYKWSCFAFGRTAMARRVDLTRGLGETKEQAEQMVREAYERTARKK